MYGTIAAWQTYATARGNDAPASASPTDATAALTRASDYIRLRYVANLLPAYDVTLQPTGFDLPLVEEAAYIAANYELATVGFFSKTFTPSDQKVLTEVKGIKWTVTGSASKTYAAMPVSTLIEAMFEPYISDPDDAGFLFKAIGGTPDG